MAADASGTHVVLEDFNLRFERPELSWVTMDPERFDTEARYIVRRARPEVWVMVIPEIVGIERSLDPTALGDVVRSNLTSLSQDVTFGPVEEADMAGIPGQLMTVRTRVSGADLYYRHWYGSYQGMMVQVAAFGEPGEADEVDRAHGEFLAGMELVDPEKIFTASCQLIEEPVERVEERFRLVFDRREWIYSDELAEDFPAAAFTANSIHEELLCRGQYRSQLFCERPVRNSSAGR